MGKHSLLLVRLLVLAASLGLQFLALEVLQLGTRPWALFLMMVGAYVAGKILQKYSAALMVNAIGWGVRWSGVAALVLWICFMVWLAFFW
ncbi:MAG: hypothetical protein ACO1OQ_05775 [Rufibacter sp.]